MQLDINFAPDFKPRYGHSRPVLKHIGTVLDHHVPAMAEVIKEMRRYSENFARIAINADFKSSAPRWINGWFPPLDGMSLYFFLADRNPGFYVEIGSGNSTKFARQAIKDHGLRTKIVSIDPEPRTEVDRIADEVLRSGLERVDLSLFSDLPEDTIVFFDGSHRCFQNSDVTVFFLEVLPELKAGTLIGIHDIFWPWDYPPTWVDRYYNEQYLLATYMLVYGKAFPVIFACAHAARRLQPELAACPPEEVARAIKEKSGYIGGTGFWFEKPPVAMPSS